jgi:hypothetical protein
VHNRRTDENVFSHPFRRRIDDFQHTREAGTPTKMYSVTYFVGALTIFNTRREVGAPT